MNHRDTHPKSDGQNHRWKKETIQLRPYKWSWASCDHSHQHPRDCQCSISEGKWTRCMVIQRASILVVIRLFIDSGGHTLGRRIIIQITEYTGNEATTCYIFERFKSTYNYGSNPGHRLMDKQTWSCLSIPRIYGRIFWVSVVFRRIHLFDTETTTITGFSLITETIEMIVEAQRSEASPRGKKSLSPELWRSEKCHSTERHTLDPPKIQWVSRHQLIL